MTTIYHIATEDDWLAAQRVGRYEVESLRTEGYIHCSTASQVIKVANDRFPGRTDLLLLCVEEKAVTAAVRFENCVGGQDLYPHIYGPLNLDAVRETREFQPDAAGLFSLPDGT